MTDNKRNTQVNNLIFPNTNKHLVQLDAPSIHVSEGTEQLRWWGDKYVLRHSSTVICDVDLQSCRLEGKTHSFIAANLMF